MTNYEDGIGESILDIDTSDAVQPSAVEAGEYKIRITGFQKKDGKIIRIDTNGNKYFMCSFDIPSEPTSKGFSKFFGIPSADIEADNPKKNNALKWELECFKRAFNLDEINFNAMVGKEGYALLIVSSSEEYGDQNNVKSFITGA